MLCTWFLGNISALALSEVQANRGPLAVIWPSLIFELISSVDNTAVKSHDTTEKQPRTGASWSAVTTVARTVCPTPRSPTPSTSPTAETRPTTAPSAPGSSPRTAAASAGRRQVRDAIHPCYDYGCETDGEKLTSSVCQNCYFTILLVITCYNQLQQQFCHSFCPFITANSISHLFLI